MVLRVMKNACSSRMKCESNAMSEVKQWLIEKIQEQPDDSSAEEILKEIAFSNMIDRGLADSAAGQVLINEAMQEKIKNKWK